MLAEHGMSPDVPGLEITETLIEEDLRYNPECPCKTRTCPQHGFCKYCLQHHADIARRMPPHPHMSQEELEASGGYECDHGFPFCLRTPTEGREKSAEKYIAAHKAD